MFVNRIHVCVVSLHFAAKTRAVTSYLLVVTCDKWLTTTSLLVFSRHVLVFVSLSATRLK